MQNNRQPVPVQQLVPNYRKDEEKNRFDGRVRDETLSSSYINMSDSMTCVRFITTNILKK